MSGALQAAFQNLRSFGSPPGQQVYTTPGCYSWVAPSGVTSVSSAVVGSGGYGATGQAYRYFCCCGGVYIYVFNGGAGGGGGGLAYSNNISVTPGNSYTVTVQSGNVCGMLRTSFGCFVQASGGSPGVNLTRGNGGTNIIGTGYTGGYGGNGCSASGYGTYQQNSGGGGGGAAGYTSIGGNGGNPNNSGQTKTGGAGGGGGGDRCSGVYYGGAGGGGSNVYGTLSPYCDTAGTGGAKNTGGGGVYGGSNAANSSTSSSSVGATYGGGGGGGGVASGGVAKTGSFGGSGAVRIIWPGNTRSFPSTCTGDL